MPTVRRWIHQHPDATALIAITMVAAAARLAFTSRAPAFIIGDSENYFLPGYQLAEGLGFDLELRRTPLYPLFIALVVSNLGEHLQGLMLAQHTLGAAAAALTFVVGRMASGPLVGLIAGMLAAISGPAIIGEHTIMAETLFAPLLLGHLALLLSAIRRGSLWTAGAAGLMLGAAILARPIGLVWVAALPIAIWLTCREVRASASTAVAILASATLIVLPWMARNVVTHGSFSADGSAGQTLVGRTLRHDHGFTFYDPSQPPDPDPKRDRVKRIMQDSVGRATFLTPVRRRIREELGVSEAEASQLMQQVALEALLHEPGYYLQSTAINFASLMIGIPERPRDAWSSRRDARNREEWEALPEIRHLLGPPSPAQDREQRTAEAIVSLYQPARWGALLLAGFTIGGVASLVRRERRLMVIPAFCAVAFIGAAVALVAPLPRYRWPVEGLIAIVAVGGIVDLVRWAVARLYRGRSASPELDRAPGTIQ